MVRLQVKRDELRRTEWRKIRQISGVLKNPGER
jgi:hypothetical protein